MALVEIRVPTFRRPNLLRRALESLKAQVHSHWVCRVLDDDPDCSARTVCGAVDDSRIHYEPNGKNLGICRNLDQAFSLPPLQGTDFLCVLEDDNYYMSSNLQQNIVTLDRVGLDVLLRNQRIEHMHNTDSPGELSAGTSFDGQYCDGILPHDGLFATFFYSTGANNSSLFWRANTGLNFSTIHYLDDPVSQERLRTLCIDRDVVIGLEPLIVWRDNGVESLRPKLNGWINWRLAQIKASAHERAIYRALDTYLAEVGAWNLAFAPDAGDFTAARERVFVRCGLPVPISARRLALTDRMSLHAKRILAESTWMAIGVTPRLSIDANKRRLK